MPTMPDPGGDDAVIRKTLAWTELEDQQVPNRSLSQVKFELNVALAAC